MSLQPMAGLDIDTLLIEENDFEPALPCESVDHPHSAGDEPAAWHVHVMCPDCGRTAQVVICEPCRLLKLKSPARCYECQGPIRESWLEFVLAIVRI